MSLELIHAWHRQELGEGRIHPSAARMVMGTPVWGEPYTSDFLAYGLPSILASREALDAAGWSLVLYVDDESWKRLAPRFEVGDIPSQFRLIPGDIMAAVRENGQWKYPILAAVHNILIHEAGRLGAGFHMMVADGIYSEHYFANLLRLGAHHQAIPHTGFATERVPTLAALEPFLQGGVLRIPAPDLGQIGWDNLVTPWRGWALTEDMDMMPEAHWMHARGTDRVHLHSAHQSAGWIGPDLCKRVTAPLGGTVDSELPRYMGNAPYATQLADEMTMVALAGSSPQTGLTPFARYKTEFWRFIGNNREFLPYMAQPCPVPLASLDPEQASVDELNARAARLMAALEP